MKSTPTAARPMYRQRLLRLASTAAMIVATPDTSHQNISMACTSQGVLMATGTGLADGLWTGLMVCGRCRPGRSGSGPGRRWPREPAVTRRCPAGRSVVGVGQVHPGHGHPRLLESLVQLPDGGDRGHLIVFPVEQ